MCFETCLPVKNRWHYVRTTHAVLRNGNIVSTRYVCFVCLFCVFHRLSARTLRLDFQFLPLFERYVVYDVIECMYVIPCAWFFYFGSL